MSEKIFQELFETIASRKGADPNSSYVASLFSKGVPKINGKIIEEASEVCEAAIQGDKEHLIYEICDLLFHTFVLAGHKEITLAELETELARRHGTSGIAEKNARTSK